MDNPDSYENPDLTNAQYHAIVDRLWRAVEGEPNCLQYDSVFDLVVAKIDRLEKAVHEADQQINRQALENIECVERIREQDAIIAELNDSFSPGW